MVKHRGLGLIGLISLSGLTSLLFGTPAFATTVEPIAPRIAQQTANADAAEQIFVEAIELFQQGTAESWRQAIAKFEQAVKLYRQAGDQRLEAVCLGYIGYTYSSLGEFQQALEFYNQALLLFRAVGDRGWEATTLNNIGVVYSSWGEFQQALDYYNQALPLIRAVGDRGGEASTLSSIGVVYRILGEFQQALDYYNQALSLIRAVGYKEEEAVTLNNIGRVYDDLGEKQQALSYYNQALPLFQVVGDREGEAATLNNIGAVYYDLGEFQQGLDYYTQALPLRRAVGDRGGEATTLNNIGLVYNSLGELQQALDYYTQALPLLQAVGDREGEAVTLNNIGLVYSSLGQKQQALGYYNQALPLRQAVGDRGGEAISLLSIAYIQRDLGNLNQARAEVEQALDIVESLRVNVTNPDLRTSYFATVQDYYQFYIDLLMQLHQQNPNQGYNALALEAHERSRARSFLELLTEAQADIRQGIDPTLLERERRLQQQLSTLEEERLQLARRTETEAELASVIQDIDSLLNQYQNLQTEIRQKSPRYAALTQPQPLSLQQMQQVLDEDTLLLQYAFGEKQSYLWVVSKNGMTSYTLPSRDEIEETARQFYDVLTIPSERLKTKKATQTGQALSQLLLAPVAEQLSNQRLLIVGEGLLNYIPFNALPMPQQAEQSNPTETQPLIVAHEILTLPSISTLALLRQEWAKRTPAPKTLAILADPVFNSLDERLNNPTVAPPPESIASVASNPSNTNDVLRDASYLSRLLGTRQEAQDILALVPPSQSLSKLDFAANRQLVMSGVLEDYQIVHFATHGLLNDDHPELSGIFLSGVNQQAESQLGFLSTVDIFNLKLQADLVVLSACRTGLGKEIKGEGLSGLTRAFMYAGASRVVASLWSVNDQATSQLMPIFYQGMMAENLSPSAALRSAQVSMWKENPSWDAYYDWAAFTIQGDWR